MRDIDKELLNACWLGDFKKVKQLLEKGADVNARDEDGWTALIKASYNGYEGIAELLIEYGADVNAQNKYGDTALIYACWNGHKEVAELLLEKEVLM